MRRPLFILHKTYYGFHLMPQTDYCAQHVRYWQQLPRITWIGLHGCLRNA